MKNSIDAQPARRCARAIELMVSASRPTRALEELDQQQAPIHRTCDLLLTS